MGMIKKFFILVILVMLPFTYLHAERAEHVFSLSPLLGFVNGRSEEIVYKFPNSSEYLSLLLWDLRPLFYAGVAADFSPQNPFNNNGFIANGSFRVGLPLVTGINENFDWLEEGDDYSHYSKHNVYSQRAFLADISLGYSWGLNDFLALSTFGEISFMHFSWLARDGFGQYPWGDHTFSGRVVEYSQTWFILSPGISLKGRINDFISLEGSFSYSPFPFCIARDHHFDRGIVFNDYVWKGHHFKIGGRLFISPIPVLNFSLNLNYRHITETRGDTLVGNSRYKNLAGAAYSAFDLGIMLWFNLWSF